MINILEIKQLTGLCFTRKYRVLDDCSRLREVIEQLQLVPTVRYTPTLVVVTWADTDGPDAAPDFGDMVPVFLRLCRTLQ